MIKQFLLNKDGSISANVNIKALEEAGIPLVMPSEMPRQSGMVAVEKEPIMIDGILTQSWELQPILQENE